MNPLNTVEEELAEEVAQSMARFKTNIRKLDRPGANVVADMRLVRHATAVMAARLKANREDVRRSSWWEQNVDYLKDELELLVPAGDIVEILNLAAMIYVRECMK